MSNIGLVLSGGMAKGAYQIGALKAISEFFAPSDFAYSSGASVGALNSYLFLTGQTDEGIDVWHRIGSCNDRHLVSNILKSDFLFETIENMSSLIPACHLFFPLLSLKKRELYYKDISHTGPAQIRDCLKASVAMPFFNQGITIDDDVLYDGAVIDNIPVSPLTDKDLDYIICIYFDNVNYIFENQEFNDRVIKLRFSDDSFITRSIVFSQDSIDSMIENGYKFAKERLNDIFGSGNYDKEHVLGINRKLTDSLHEKGEKCVRVSGDVLVRNMNKLTRKLVRKS